MKLLEENREIKLLDKGFGKEFLDIPPKAQATKSKINQVGPHQAGVGELGPCLNGQPLLSSLLWMLQKNEGQCRQIFLFYAELNFFSLRYSGFTLLC